MERHTVFMSGGLHRVRMLIRPKIFYSFNNIPIKSYQHFCRYRQDYSKMYMVRLKELE